MKKQAKLSTLTESPFWLKLFSFLAFFLPFSFALNVSSSIDLPIVRLLIVIIFFFFLFWSLENRIILIDKRASFWLLGLFLIICSLSYFWATDGFRAGRKVIFLWSFFPVYLISFVVTQNKDWLEKVLRNLVRGGLAVAILAIALFLLQFILGLDPTLNLIGNYLAPFFLGKNFADAVLAYPSWLVNINGVTLLRTFGTFPDPHIFALYLNMLLPFSFLIWQKKKEQKSKFPLTSIIILLAALLSFTRAAYFSLIFGLGFIILVNWKKVTPTKKPLLLPILFTLLTFFFLIPNPLTSRLISSFNLQEGSNQGRILMWQAAYQMTKEHPLLGVGLGNFSRILEPNSNYRDPIYAHNLWLDFSAETGIFNALILLVVLLLPILRYLKNKTPLGQAVALSLVIFIIHSMFETPLYSIHILPLLFLILAIEEPVQN